MPDDQVDPAVQVHPDSPYAQAGKLLDSVQNLAVPKWSDESRPPEERVGDFLNYRAMELRNKKEPTNADWYPVEKELSEKFPGVNVDAAKDHFTKSQRQQWISQGLSQAKDKYKGFEENTVGFIGRRAVPFFSTMATFAESRDYQRALERLKNGDYDPGDFARVAHYERLQQAEAEKGTAGTVFSAAAHIPAILGEAALAAPFVKALGLSPALLRGGAGAGEVAVSQMTRSLPTAMGLSARAVGGAATQTALMPSMYLDQAQRRALQQGGEFYEAKNLGPALTVGMAQVALLGAIGRAPGAAATGAPQTMGLVGRSILANNAKGWASRWIAGSATGMSGQQAIDLGQHALGWSTSWGAVPDLLAGKEGSFKHFASQAVVFSIFSALHAHHNPQVQADADGMRRSMDWVNKAAEAYSRGFEPGDAEAAERGARVFSDAMKGLLTPEAVEKMPQGPERTLAEKLTSQSAGNATKAIVQDVADKAAQNAPESTQPPQGQPATEPAKAPPTPLQAKPEQAPAAPRTPAERAATMRELADQHEQQGQKEAASELRSMADQLDPPKTITKFGMKGGMIRQAKAIPPEEVAAKWRAKADAYEEGGRKDIADMLRQHADELSPKPAPAEGESVFHIAEYKQPGRSVDTALEILERKGSGPRPLETWDSGEGKGGREGFEANFNSAGHVAFELDTGKLTGELERGRVGREQGKATSTEPLRYNPGLKAIHYKGSEADPAFARLKAEVDRINEDRADGKLMQEYGHKEALDPVELKATEKAKAAEPVAPENRPIEPIKPEPPTPKAAEPKGFRLTDAQRDEIADIYNRPGLTEKARNQSLNRWIKDNISDLATQRLLRESLGVKRSLSERAETPVPEDFAAILREQGDRLTDRERHILTERSRRATFDEIREDKEAFSKGKPVARQAIKKTEAAALRKIDFDHESMESYHDAKGAEAATAAPPQVGLERVSAEPEPGSTEWSIARAREFLRPEDFEPWAKRLAEIDKITDRHVAEAMLDQLEEEIERVIEHRDQNRGSAPVRRGDQSALGLATPKGPPEAATEGTPPAASPTHPQGPGPAEGNQPGPAAPATNAESPGNVVRDANGRPMAMGAAALGELTPDTGRVYRGETALANARIDAERLKEGLNPIIGSARMQNAEAWDEAMQRLSADPKAGERLVDEIIRKPRPTDVVEQAMLLREKIRLDNEYRALQRQIIDAEPSKRPPLESRLEEVGDERTALDTAVKRTGTELGRSLQFRRQLAAEDYSLAGMLRSKEVAVGKKLTTEQEAEVAILHRRIADLEAQLTQYSAFGRAAADPKTVSLLGRLKNQFSSRLIQDRWMRKPLNEKLQDLYGAFRRAMVLSSPIVVAKLNAAVATRMITKIPEEALGAAYGRLFPGLGRATMMERGSASAMAAEWATLFSRKALQASYDTLRTGKSDLDIEYGGRDKDMSAGAGMSRPVLEFFGRVHGAIKAPLKTAVNEGGLVRGAEYYLARGEDPNMHQLEIGMAAYKAANRSIFMQDNIVSDAVNKFIGRLEKVDPETGRPNAYGKAGATLMRHMLPVVKVPTNIVGETLVHMTGLVTGTIGLGRAYVRGIENLSPEQADSIMRQLKKGSLGGAMLALGFALPGNFGGYHQPGEHQKEGEPESGGMKIGDTTIPRYWLHNPLLEAAQVGATLRKVSDKQGWGWGVYRSLFGLVQEAPMVREAMDVGKLEGPDRDVKGLAAQQVKSAVVPAGASWIARNIDRTPEGEKIERSTKATSTGERVRKEVQSGVPIWRYGLVPRK